MVFFSKHAIQLRRNYAADTDKINLKSLTLLLFVFVRLSDGSRPEGSDQPHVRCPSAPQEETDHLLQHLPPAI